MFHRTNRPLHAYARQRVVSALLSLILCAGLLHITYADALDHRADADADAPQELSGRIFLIGLPVEDGAAYRFAVGTELSLCRRDLVIPVFTEEDETAAALLHRLRIDVAEDEAVLVDCTAEPYRLTIASDFTCEIERHEADPMTIRYEPDPSLAWGEETVAQEGCDGYVPVRTRLYVESGRVVTEEALGRGESTMQPRIIRYGTRSKYTTVQVLSYTGGTVTVNGESLAYRRALRMTGTAYTAGIGAVDTVTATGTTVRVGVVAVDPRVIPLGSKLFIECAKGSYVYGVAGAEDTGVRGSVIDLYMDSYDACVQFGRRAVNVYILE